MPSFLCVPPLKKCVNTWEVVTLLFSAFFLVLIDLLFSMLVSCCIGTTDTDCPANGLCCFDGCANTCVDGPKGAHVATIHCIQYHQNWFLEMETIFQEDS